MSVSTLRKSTHLSLAVASFLLALISLCTQSKAQETATESFRTMYEVHGGLGLSSGVNIGARIQPWRSLGFEASIGTLLISPTLTAGINIPAPSVFADIQTSWSVFGTYFKSTDASWYGITASYGILQIGVPGLHAFGRLGASLMFKQNAGILAYPLPSFDIGLAWTFGDR